MSINVCNDRSMASITSLPSGVSGSSLVLLETKTASSDGTLSFTSGIDSTYKEYIFKYVNVHPASNNVDFQFNMSADSGSNYNVTKTTTTFQAYLNEGDSANGLAYGSSRDLAQSTDFQGIVIGVGNGNDEAASGYLHIFEPSCNTPLFVLIKCFTKVVEDGLNKCSVPETLESLLVSIFP